MQTVNDAIRLLRLQQDIETAMRKPGGIRITEEQELVMVKPRSAEYPEATLAVMQAAHAMRTPVTAVTARVVEAWANPSALVRTYYEPNDSHRRKRAIAVNFTDCASALAPARDRAPVERRIRLGELL